MHSYYQLTEPHVTQGGYFLTLEEVHSPGDKHLPLMCPTEVYTCLCKVGALSRALAVRTLQLELEYIYGCLEEEALDIGQGIQNPTFLLSRQVHPSTHSCDPASLEQLPCLP